MRHSQTDESSDKRCAELSARVNLTTALLAHAEAILAQQLAETKQYRKYQRWTAPARSMAAWISSIFRANR